MSTQTSLIECAECGWRGVSSECARDLDRSRAELCPFCRRPIAPRIDAGAQGAVSLHAAASVRRYLDGLASPPTPAGRADDA